jgi:HD-GYP domain-containing protein (c-di-GMP phosphodiesterase class II)
LPEEIANKTYDTMSPEEKSIYHTHPIEGLKLIQNKKVIAGEGVNALLIQHHEFMDGSGYPYGLRKDRIHLMARICQIADELDELTSVKTGKQATLSPLEALSHMITKNITSTGGEKYDSVLLEQLKGIFKVPSSRPMDMKNVKELFERPVIPPKTTESFDQDLKRRKRIKRPG